MTGLISCCLLIPVDQKLSLSATFSKKLVLILPVNYKMTKLYSHIQPSLIEILVLKSTLRKILLCGNAPRYQYNGEEVPLRHLTV